MSKEKFEELGELKLKLTLDLSQAKEEIRECTELLKSWDMLLIEQEKDIIEKVEKIRESLKGASVEVEKLDERNKEIDNGEDVEGIKGE